MEDNVLQEIVSRFSASDYSSRLQIWDDLKLNFKDDKLSYSDGTIAVSIMPYGAVENRIYNKWIIDHWRSYYIEQLYRLDEVADNVDLVFKSFDVLKQEFDLRLLNVSNKHDFVLNELRNINGQLVRLSHLNKKFVAKIYSKFKNQQKSDFYNYAPTVANRFIKLRLLAKVWDLTEYKIFLEDKVSHSKIGIVAELDFYVLRKLTSEGIEQLHNFLIKEKCMKCSIDLFKQVFQISPRTSSEKILWIDVADSNKDINKQTLLQLITSLTGELTFKHSLLYKFIQSSFKTKKIVGDVDIPFTTENLKSSFKTFRKTEEIAKKQLSLKSLVRNISQ